MKINKESASLKTTGNLSDDELKLINKYTRRPLGKDEVYTFSLVLCDNEADRDCEVFSLDSLEKLKDLFLGKTGIKDHEAKSGNQTARIYKTELEFLEGVNSIGERRARLIAKAYIPVADYTKDIIDRIESGILKEVSVGCSVKNSRCSICGKSGCSHVKGRVYGGKTCLRILENADDAYEFSFVAVPAQKNAAVQKKFENIREEKNVKEIFKNLKEGEQVTLSFNEAEALAKALKWGEKYREELINTIKKACCILSPNMDGEIMEEMAEALDTEKLVSLCKYYEAELERKLPLKTQLAENQNKTRKETNNGGFKI